jgi:hypothetical protein
MATAARMARYDVARRQLVRYLLRTYGGIDPTISEATGHTSVPLEMSSTTVGGEIRSVVRCVIAACRWAYARVAL